jgi:hypothetical protein
MTPQSSQAGGGSEKLWTRTEDLVRKMNVTAPSTLGIGQVGVVQRKVFLALGSLGVGLLMVGALARGGETEDTSIL